MIEIHVVKQKSFTFSTSILLAMSLVVGASTTVSAATLNFSYTWGDDALTGSGSNMSGTFEGDFEADNNTILNPSLVLATWRNPNTGQQIDFRTNRFTNTVVTRDGSNIFWGGFQDAPLLVPSFSFRSNTDAIVSDAAPLGFQVNRANEQFDPSRWRIAEVPEPSEWIQGGLALLGCSFILFRRRSKSAR